MKERKFISESVKKLLVSEYIRKETESAGFGGMEMKRTPFGTNITLFVNKPGLVIGRRGGKIQEITATLEKRFGVETPQVEVKEVADPDLNPQIVAKKIAISLEKGWSYRKAGNTTLRRTVDSNAKGVLIKIAGKISGERARSQKFISGSIKYSGEPGRIGMKYGFSTAKLKLGIIGVSVRILDSEYKLPDQIDINKVDPEKLVQPQVKVETPAEPVKELVPEIPVVEKKKRAPRTQKEPQAEKPKKKTAEKKTPAKPRKKAAKKEEKEDKKEVVEDAGTEGKETERDE
ncbi:30S ribosomal protein S3P [mine drainage metagenome]|uniref:30S ribosomal protein S3 n=2 Tax=mine drainage metagenome TaxID=410659 RepID=T0ZPW0_9ZZZZ